MSIQEIQQKIAPILRKYGIRHAAVFGSVSRGTNKPESDIDLLVKLGKPMGMFAYMRLLRELEAAVGSKVDLVTENSLNKFVKPYVTPELKTIYEE
ncbi:MAG: nucleotidyltransferase family protein [bacterium]|nr:nucleotidyltransferase family protein [bacterium]